MNYDHPWFSGGNQTRFGEAPLDELELFLRREGRFRKRKADTTSESSTPQPKLVFSPTRPRILKPWSPLTDGVTKADGAHPPLFPAPKQVLPLQSPPNSIVKVSSTDVRSDPLKHSTAVTASRTNTPEICLSHIWKRCERGDRCSKVHYHLPYRWQVYNEPKWEDLPGMEEIERKYSEPGIESFKEIDFQAMTASGKPARRLSTPSSVTEPAGYVLTTDWVWYWKDDTDVWKEYVSQSEESGEDSCTSSKLEKEYDLNPSGTFALKIRTQNYVINFKEMKERNTFCGTEREVRRRPKLVDYKKVQMLKGRTKSAVGTSSYPSLWDLKLVPDIGYQKVLVGESSSEFSQIAAMFKKTASNFTVKTLWRVQNAHLWNAYVVKKKEMIARNPQHDVYERQLFHGTNSANIDAICSDNVDWRMCGTHGTVYGKGRYFARDACYSHGYSQSSSKTWTMLVARVLVGDFTEGDITMKLPPQKPNSSQRYDSVVNSVSDPSIFVVFDKTQVYPEYFLEYEQ